MRSLAGRWNISRNRFAAGRNARRFYLLDDRLCYAKTAGRASGIVKYLPLDKIPVRPYPRGFTPRAGVTRTPRDTVRTCTPKQRRAKRRRTEPPPVQVPADTLPGGKKTSVDCHFVLQCGEMTHVIAADSPALAKRRASLKTVSCSACSTPQSLRIYSFSIFSRVQSIHRYTSFTPAQACLPPVAAGAGGWRRLKTPGRTTTTAATGALSQWSALQIET